MLNESKLSREEQFQGHKDVKDEARSLLLQKMKELKADNIIDDYDVRESDLFGNG